MFDKNVIKSYYKFFLDLNFLIFTNKVSVRVSVLSRSARDPGSAVTRV